MAATIREVARATGVSTSTVSRALALPELVAEPTRRRVQDIARSMGYRPNRAARGLVTGRMSSIGLIVPDLEDPFFASICKAAQARAHSSGYSLVVGDTDQDPVTEIDTVRDLAKEVDGIVLCSP